MQPLEIFFIQLSFAFLLMGLAARWWAWPRLRALPVQQALTIVLFGGAIRYMGTLLLHPALAPSPHPDVVAAWGDVAVAVLALLGIFANRAGARIGKPLAWLYVVIGGADMIRAFANGLRVGTWENLTGGWTFVVTAFPAVGVMLVLTLLLLVRPQPRAGAALHAAT
jgi:hypothetical protein